MHIYICISIYTYLRHTSIPYEQKDIRAYVAGLPTGLGDLDGFLAPAATVEGFAKSASLAPPKGNPTEGFWIFPHVHKPWNDLIPLYVYIYHILF